MRREHVHLVAQGLNDMHFDTVVENLAATPSRRQGQAHAGLWALGLTKVVSLAIGRATAARASDDAPPAKRDVRIIVRGD
jgi:hypothetical protein